MKNIVHLDVYPTFDENGKIQAGYPMYKLYELAKGKDIRIVRILSKLSHATELLENERAVTPHISVTKTVNLPNDVLSIEINFNLIELKDPEFENDDNIINKLLRLYCPDVYKEGFEIVSDYGRFHPRCEWGTIEDFIDILTNKAVKDKVAGIPFGDLATNVILTAQQKTHEKIHLIHFDPRSYYNNCYPDKKERNMVYLRIPGNPEDVCIYHPMDMHGKVKYYEKAGMVPVPEKEQHYRTYPLWLWDVDLFDKNKRPVFNEDLHMFVRLNRTLTEPSLKAYDDITTQLFLSGNVDYYHIFTSAENKEKWIVTNDKVLRKISPNLNIDFKSIKNCNESGFSYVSLRSRRYPFITPKFLELLGNGIVPLLNMATSETMSIRELFPSDLYIGDAADIERNIENMRDPKVFNRVIDVLWEKIEGSEQPLVDILGLK